MKDIRIMCIHGLGDQRHSGWEDEWKSSIEQAVGDDAAASLKFDFVNYDPIFNDVDLSIEETSRAALRLIGSGIGSIFRRSRGPVGTINKSLRWTAGYVIAWLEDKEFQVQTRHLILERAATFKPDVILAHSLGSLVSYDALMHKDALKSDTSKALKKAHYVTFGSQIGNPFVIGNLSQGRLQKLPVLHWHNLYNKHDRIFTTSISAPSIDNFHQLLTPFDWDGFSDHSAAGYLTHDVTRAALWAPLVDGAQDTGASRYKGNSLWNRSRSRKRRDSQKRALLIGIDEYPRESDRLLGCVNDVFSMSATLQDCGFAPEEIRTCLNERATADGILSRFEWLVDDASAGDTLVFYYSGHGARVPEYGARQEPDHLSETLVPYDFDWSPERSFSDEQIFRLYSQLPYELQFLMVFDCCHAAGMHRQSSARARGLGPPDDIRHRELKWNGAEEMWVDRTFSEINNGFARSKNARRDFFGRNLATLRLGRAAPLRVSDEKTYKKAKSAGTGPVGPFLPLILESCREDELAFEYLHGATSFGAFTYCLTSILRKEKNLTFETLLELTSDRLKRLGYEQSPQLFGPEAQMKAKVPLETGKGGSPASAVTGGA